MQTTECEPKRISMDSSKTKLEESLGTLQSTSVKFHGTRAELGWPSGASKPFRIFTSRPRGYLMPLRDDLSMAAQKSYAQRDTLAYCRKLSGNDCLSESAQQFYHFREQ